MCVHSLEKYIPKVETRAFKYGTFRSFQEGSWKTLLQKAHCQSHSSWSQRVFAKKRKIGCNANWNARAMHACNSPKKKGAPILKAMKWIDNSCCWNEQLMKPLPISWVTLETRQMVHPPNRDCTNFTERRFSQDSERKWIDGKIHIPKLRLVPQAELPLAGCGAVPNAWGSLFSQHTPGHWVERQAILRPAQFPCCKKNVR